MPLISPSRFSATIFRQRFAQAFNRARGICVGARLERVFALQFKQCADLEQNFRDLVFVHRPE